MFFFSSRRRHTRSKRDWSSDVCSSDLEYRTLSTDELVFVLQHHWSKLSLTLSADDFTDAEAIAAVARITGGNFRLVQQIGRASCRERVWSAVVAGGVEENNRHAQEGRV